MEGSEKKKKRIWELFRRRELPTSNVGEEQKHGQKDRVKKKCTRKMAVGPVVASVCPQGEH